MKTWIKVVTISFFCLGIMAFVAYQSGMLSKPIKSTKPSVQSNSEQELKVESYVPDSGKVHLISRPQKDSNEINPTKKSTEEKNHTEYRTFPESRDAFLIRMSLEKLPIHLPSSKSSVIASPIQLNYREMQHNFDFFWFNRHTDTVK